MEEKEPYEIVVKGSEKVIGYACPTCHVFMNPNVFACVFEEGLKHSKKFAAECCNKKCTECSTKIEKKSGYAVCGPCRLVKEVEREAKRFEKAEKLTIEQYDGWLYDDGDYYADVDALLDDYADKDLEVPPYVWACTETKLRIDAQRLVESALEDHHDEAGDLVDAADVEELQKLLDTWCEKQNVVSWESDYSRVILLQEDNPYVDEAASTSSTASVDEGESPEGPAPQEGEPDGAAGADQGPPAGE